MNASQLIQELSFKATRSSGPGGQHVNKVSSKVMLFFNIEASLSFSELEKERIFKNLKHRITNENLLVLSCDETRSQHKNKELVTKRFFNLIKENLKKPKIRRVTKPTKASVYRKAEGKKRNSLKKAMRKKPRLE